MKFIVSSTALFSHLQAISRVIKKFITYSGLFPLRTEDGTFYDCFGQ